MDVESFYNIPEEDLRDDLLASQEEPLRILLRDLNYPEDLTTDEILEIRNDILEWNEDTTSESFSLFRDVVLSIDDSKKMKKLLNHIILYRRVDDLAKLREYMNRQTLYYDLSALISSFKGSLWMIDFIDEWAKEIKDKQDQKKRDVWMGCYESCDPRDIQP